MDEPIPIASEEARPSVHALPYAPLARIVDVWWCSLVQPAEIVAELGSSLSSAENERAARFGSAALRERYITGRAVLRRLLGDALSMPPATVPIVRSRRGRPVLQSTPSIDFNVSHTRGTAVFAIGTGLAEGVRVGVDVEHTERILGVDRLARKLLTAAERDAMAPLGQSERRRRFLQTWTCKEAMSKATGDGLSAPFGKFSVNPGTLPQLLEGPDPYTLGRWQLYRVPMPGDFIVTLALWKS